MGNDSWLRVERPRKDTVAFATVASTVTAIAVFLGLAILPPTEHATPEPLVAPSPAHDRTWEIAEVDSALDLGNKTLDDLAKGAALNWYWDTTINSARMDIHKAMDLLQKKRALLERESGK